MKHLSMGLTALFLGVLPFAAAAFDYGPNQALLAANQSLPASDSDLPALPGAQANPGPGAASAHGEASGATDEEASTAAPAAPGAERATPTPAGNRGTSASNAAHHAAPPSSTPLVVPTQPSWQSLLPGSIQ